MSASSRREALKLDPSLHSLMHLERVTLDTSILIGPKSLEFAIAARLRYYRGYWSTWIVAEFSRVRTELVIARARRQLGITDENEADEAIQGELERRLLRSRAKVNAAVDEFSRVLTSVNYQDGQGADIFWLQDEDDIPVMLTAIAAGVPGVLVTDNKKDLPIGQVRNGILIVSGEMFLDYLYLKYPESEEVITRYARNRREALRDGRLLPPL